MDGPYFGPFNPQTFLEPPITHASMFALEQFRLCTAEGEEIGLDMIHEDNANEAADIMASGLYWEGLVLFEESDRREISRNGLRQLQRFSEEQGMPVNWEENTRILLRAEYWRHAIILDNTKPQWPVSATVFIDTRSDGDPNAAGSEIGYRRFKVKRSPRFTQLSTKSLSQAVLYHIMTYISRVKGRHVSFDQRDVSWYASWFRQLYSKDPRVDFAELLRVQLESHAFVEVLVAHRRLISKGNVTLFMRRQRPVAAQSPELEDNVLRMQEEDELMDNEYGEEFDQYNRMTPAESVDISLDDGPRYQRNYRRSFSRSFTPIARTATRNYEESRDGSSSRSSRASSYDPDDLRRLIPVEMRGNNPVLPPSCIWHCPVSGCYTVLNLKGTLPRWALQLLDSNQIRFLRHGGFTARSGDAQHIFRTMLNAHYNDHLHRVGLTIVGDTLTRIEPSLL
ncbi:hypothetical protein PIIN_01689 [Serendipita indica DSM 11827]|uniref:Uncharacterized protein n=1 Tax=Serendipita indica (strain DSM 11827) TaxID=1109443 RepID=G4T962_SERID|nr:hypothetical protein PIIN_01689 [Serendipita indica DSM 11827]